MVFQGRGEFITREKHPKTPQNVHRAAKKTPPPPQIFLARTTPPFHRAAKSRKAPDIWQICRHTSFHARQLGCRSGRTPHSGSPPYHIGSPLLIVAYPLLIVVNPPLRLVGWSRVDGLPHGFRVAVGSLSHAYPSAQRMLKNRKNCTKNRFVLLHLLA